MRTPRLIPAIFAGCLTIFSTATLAEQLHRKAASTTAPARMAANQSAREYLEYYLSAKTLDKPEFLQKFESVETIVSNSSTGFNSLRLAILLSISGTPVRDFQRARQLIRDFLRLHEDVDKESSAFARALLVSIGEKESQIEKFWNLERALLREREAQKALQSQLDLLDSKTEEYKTDREHFVKKLEELEGSLTMERNSHQTLQNLKIRLKAEIVGCENMRGQYARKAGKLELDLSKEREHRKTLQEQLDQLKEIEKNISEKEQSIIVPEPKDDE